MSATLGDDLAERLVNIMSSSARTASASENGAAPTDSAAEEHVANSLDRSLGEEAAGSCRLLSCEGRMFPVRTKYLGAPGTQRSLPHPLFCCRVGPGQTTCPAIAQNWRLNQMLLMSTGTKGVGELGGWLC